MNDPTEGDRKVTRCESCGDTVECEYAPDPFAEDVHHDFTLVWECASCRHESAMDI
jgi:uncharacterized protein with PIN domain